MCPCVCESVCVRVGERVCACVHAHVCVHFNVFALVIKKVPFVEIFLDLNASHFQKYTIGSCNW